MLAEWKPPLLQVFLEGAESELFSLVFDSKNFYHSAINHILIDSQFY